MVIPVSCASAATSGCHAWSRDAPSPRQKLPPWRAMPQRPVGVAAMVPDPVGVKTVPYGLVVAVIPSTQAWPGMVWSRAEPRSIMAVWVRRSGRRAAHCSSSTLACSSSPPACSSSSPTCCRPQGAAASGWGWCSPKYHCSWDSCSSSFKACSMLMLDHRRCNQLDNVFRGGENHRQPNPDP